MSTSPTKRPTIAELEAILNDPNPGTISIAPDGSVHVLPHGMARESQAEVDSLRAELAPLRELVGVDSRAKSALADIDHWKKLMDAWDENVRLKARLAAAEADAKAACKAFEK